MSSLREVLAITKTAVEDPALFGPQIMEVFIDIIINLSEICDEEQLPISDEVWGFEVKRNEWVIALL